MGLLFEVERGGLDVYTGCPNKMLTLKLKIVLGPISPLKCTQH